jgi:hypothetical protein
MTLSSEQPSPVPLDAAVPVGPPAECRQWLAGVADLLIPAAGDMPAASEMDVAGRQLDVVLGARPDLTRHLLRGWQAAAESDAEESVRLLQELDAEAYDAVRMVVAGGYYIHPRVRRLLRYDGQEPRTVRVDQVPEYLEEGLLERVMERGPIYREA